MEAGGERGARGGGGKSRRRKEGMQEEDFIIMDLVSEDQNIAGEEE